MNNEMIMQRILELTVDESWSNDPKTYEEVRALGRMIWTRDETRWGKNIVVFHSGKIVASGTAGKLSKIVGLDEKIIRQRARTRKTDAKGRQFKYAEENR